jgi:hypothetical protein
MEGVVQDIQAIVGISDVFFLVLPFDSDSDISFFSLFSSKP